MFTIGDFARLGRVSVRMLRHYDAVGLLLPAHVDPSSGYRSYTAAQLHRLNRLVALKELGLTLDQVRVVLDEQVSVEQLHGMLSLRRAELRQQILADSARLRRVEARLRAIEREGAMPTDEIVVKQVPAVRVARLGATAASYQSEDIGPVIQPLYPQLFERLARAGVVPVGGGIATYEPAEGEQVLVRAGVEVAVDVEPSASHDFEVVDLPALAQAATIVHHGPMDDVDATYQAVAAWVEAHGYRQHGFAREVYLCYGQGDPAGWTTELQLEITQP
ncbi:DNA-binding transcriptional regulator, MerR family [Lentzea xinjiangensis]|uniref:DNA-binding transcriptional regulator, MerR family n=1 Tax=Lentzea xinjiangensis TaxID=402600 RepID=A0A1H9PE00_9PSEU|nr:MerR family transcriptional regulator [Lentzea xinjiangensis]SER45793.1 DNA-binding transcriptional regulator, MerR family [Lentzea xinjiangensis]